MRNLVFLLVLTAIAMAPAVQAAGLSCGPCGALNPSDASRCLVCGRPLASAAAPQPRPVAPVASGSPPPPSPSVRPPEPAPASPPTPSASPEPAGGATADRPGPAPKAPVARRRRARTGHARVGPRPAPTMPESRPTGTLELMLVYRGDRPMASAATVEVDGSPAGRAESEESDISAGGMVRIYRYERAVPSGSRRVKVSLMGMRADRPDDSMVTREFEIITVVPQGKPRSLHHEWDGGIEEFSRMQRCCHRGHRP